MKKKRDLHAFYSCEKQFSNYICPRCNLRYCSLACYKDLEHAECTESFYKESVTEEIKNRDVDKESKSKMLAMLKRLEDEDETEDLLREDEQENLLERFKHINLEEADSEEIWELLPEKERKQFESLVSRLGSNLSHPFDLPHYIPWWTVDRPKGIQEVEEEQDSTIPQLPNELPDLKTMTKQTTSPHLIWNLIHILAIYSYLMRRSTGDLLEHPQDTLQVIEKLSVHVLFSTAPSCPYRSIEDVLGDIVERVLHLQEQRLEKQRSGTRYDLKLLLLKDLTFLVPECNRATFDLWQVLKEVPEKKKKKVALAIRKLYFYWAVACSLEGDRLDIISAMVRNTLSKVEIEKKEFEQDHERAQQAMKEHQKSSTSKIQEIE